LTAYPGGKNGSYTIPNSVTIIGDDAFSDCTGLTAVTNLNPVPQNIDSYSSYVFNGVNISAITLKVPADAVSAYRAANVWKDFGTIAAIE
jgi:hypothetical protein